MATAFDRYGRSFSDALSLARSRRDQATIYYSKGESRAVYDVVTDFAARYNNTGTMIVNGHVITTSDIPSDMPLPDGAKNGDIIVASNAPTARRILRHNGIDTETGWDLRP